MLENLVPMVVMTGMFAMIFGIVYIRSRENMAMIERGLNPRNKDVRPRPFVNLKWGLLLMGAGMGLLLAYMVDNIILDHPTPSPAATITFGGHHTKVKKKAVVADTTNTAKDTSAAATPVSVLVNNDDANDDEDEHSITEIRGGGDDNAAIYFALIAIGGGLGLFFSYRIEKKEWLDKKM